MLFKEISEEVIYSHIRKLDTIKLNTHIIQHQICKFTFRLFKALAAAKARAIFGEVASP